MLHKNIFINSMRVCLNHLIHYAPLIIGIITVMIGLYLSMNPKIDRTNSIKSMELRYLRGIILSVEAIGHENYRIGVIDKLTNEKLSYNLWGHLLFNEQYNIKIGDSISKDTNSRILIFHSRKENGIYEKGYIYELPQY